ncbi:MAG: ABC transporter substrate-binding protein [Geminicoccaceae bacterium]
MKRRTILAAVMAGTWPALLRAQQKATPVIGWLSSAAPGPSRPALAAFRQALGESGYVEGQNFTIEYRWAEGRYDLLPGMAADLVSRGVDAIVTVSFPAAHAAKAASGTIPIIFLGGGDPVAAGLVASLARPGGNLTGVGALVVDLFSKRLQLLREVIPSAAVIAVLVNPTHPDAQSWIRDIEGVARSAAVQLHILKAGSMSEIDDAFASAVQQQAGALVVDGDPFFFVRREQVVALAARHAIPTIYSYPEFARAGGLISYSGSTKAVFRQIGVYTGRILKGAKPADLPVVQATDFEMVVNLKTAKALGLTISPLILARADDVIE